MGGKCKGKADTSGRPYRSLAGRCPNPRLTSLDAHRCGRKRLSSAQAPRALSLAARGDGGRGSARCSSSRPGRTTPTSTASPRISRNGTRNSMRLHDWGQMHRARPGHKLLFWFPRGRVVGGSSAVNTCIALRGQPHDYDEWASMGLPEWSWDKCLPAFKRLENDLDVKSQWHAQSGPVPLRRHTSAELAPWQAAFLEACQALGFPWCDDSNDPTTTGAGPHAMNLVDGVRMSAARCYLDEATRSRAEPDVRPHTLVRRVLLRDRARRRRRGRDARARARARARPASSFARGRRPRRASFCGRASARAPRWSASASTSSSTCPRSARGSSTTRARPSSCGRVRRTASRDGTSSRPCSATRRRRARATTCSCRQGPSFRTRTCDLPLVSIMAERREVVRHGDHRVRSPNPHATPRIESRLLVNDADRERALEAMQLAVELARTPPMRELATLLLAAASAS